MLLMLYSEFDTSDDFVCLCVCVHACAHSGLCCCVFRTWMWTVDDDLRCQVSFTPVLARDTVKLTEPKHKVA